MPDRTDTAKLARMTLNLDVLARLLYPCACYLCRRPFHASRTPDLCGECRSGLRVRQNTCFHCARPAAAASCHECQRNTPSFQRTYALCLYGAGQPGQMALRRWKIGGEINLGRALGRALGRPLRHQLGPIDGIVPIPGRRIASAWRGFDTANLLAETLSQVLPESPPVFRNFVCRVPHWHWGGAGRRRRARRLMRSSLYRPGSGKIPQGARLLLVDDIMTTQASARRCSDLLLEGGAARIEVAVIGRTTNS